MNFTGERAVFGPGAMIEYPHVFQEHLARYVFALKYVTGAKNILDVACGTGYGAALLSCVTRGEVMGFDRDQESVDYARNTFGDFALFQKRDIELSPLRDGDTLYEAVVSFETIEHVDVDKYFAFIRHHMKGDGVLIVSSPVNPDGKPQNPNHKFEFTPQGFVDAFRSRFGVVELFRQDGSNITPADTLEGAGYGIAVCKGWK